MNIQPNSIRLGNSRSILEIDVCGGAISNFQMKPEGLNPLNFNYPLDGIPCACGQAAFKGHFVCLGRWGDPSPAERATGAIKHGDFYLREWEVLPPYSDSQVRMRVISPVEKLQLEREVMLEENDAVFYVRETISGRYYNIVQHPTIAAPFLHASTRVFSNADAGICQEVDPAVRSQWPVGLTGKEEMINLEYSYQPDNHVFSFIVEPGAPYGWQAAWSPADKLLIGYIWPRADFPWINCWQHSENGKMRYRGLEFGTSGIHAPLEEILQSGKLDLLGEKTVRFLGAGENITTRYAGFLAKIEDEITDITVIDRNIRIQCSGRDKAIELRMPQPMG
ncbi:hypothetical protein [Chitinophaga sp.]|uniref:hypothetical protein n=1 Tax=Chitinophaga sp. TaxID=1869181 RepID=UPI00262AF421|nr:hypothetical protein [uncultured Chitinophaga sp.]